MSAAVGVFGGCAPSVLRRSIIDSARGRCCGSVSCRWCSTSGTRSGGRTRPGELFRKVISQRKDLVPGATIQGFYAFAPGGALILGWNDRGWNTDQAASGGSAGRICTGAGAAALTGASDPLCEHLPPSGARRPFAHRRGQLARGGERPRARPKAGLRFRHRWILAEEGDLPGAGTFPLRPALRIARFHCVDNTRGAPPTWEIAEVRRLRVDAPADAERPGAASVDGEIVLRSADGQRGYAARLGGDVEVRAGVLRRFDVAIRGAFFGDGIDTRGAPCGRVTLAIVLTLAAAREHAKAPPHGARWLDGHLGQP